MGEGMMIVSSFIFVGIIIISILRFFINPILLIIVFIISYIIFYYYMAYKWNDYKWMCDIGKRSPVREEKEKVLYNFRTKRWNKVKPSNYDNKDYECEV